MRQTDATNRFVQAGRALTDVERRNGWTIVFMFATFVVATLLFESSPVHGVTLCPFRRLTGYSCFGCGMTRSCVAVMHGHLAASLTYHPFGILFVVGFAATAFDRLAQNLLGFHLDYPGRAFWKSKHNRVLIGCLIALVIFGIARFALEVSGFLTPV